MRLLPVRLALALLVSAAAARAQSEDSAQDARQPRRFAVGGEVGMNSLASLFGPVVTYWAAPAIPVDLGFGLSVSGFRSGLRARYLFTPLDKTSFFGGAGLKFAMGSGGQDFKVEDPDTKAKLRAKTNPTAFADLLAGTEFLANNGFLLVFSAGYSILLTEDPYEITDGEPSKKGKRVFDTMFGSGISLSLTLGKAF